MDTLETTEQFNELINKGKVIFVFSADWCPDCRVVEPFYPEIMEAFPEYTFMMVDRDEFIDICQAYDVFGIPSFIAFDDGKEIGRFVSKERKTKEEIVQFIKGLSV